MHHIMIVHGMCYDKDGLYLGSYPHNTAMPADVAGRVARIEFRAEIEVCDEEGNYID